MRWRAISESWVAADPPGRCPCRSPSAWPTMTKMGGVYTLVDFGLTDGFCGSAEETRMR
jgi:hypothetical protein